jgi:hypothetical protein
LSSVVVQIKFSRSSLRCFFLSAEVTIPLAYPSLSHHATPHHTTAVLSRSSPRGHNNHEGERISGFTESRLQYSKDCIRTPHFPPPIPPFTSAMMVFILRTSSL